MKKKIIFIFFIFNLALLPAEEAFFNFSAGVSSGAVFSTSPEVKALKNTIGNAVPFNFGTEFYLNINPTKYISFFAGSDLFFNINAKNHQYYNQFSVLIPFGIKIYPDLKGFCIGAAYAPGTGNDYYKTTDMSESSKQKCCWGNGFKFSLEYNFSHCSSQKNYPTIGLSFASIPRGNYTRDNLLTAFINVNF